MAMKFLIFALCVLLATCHKIPLRAGNWTLVMKNLPLPVVEMYYCQTFHSDKNAFIVGVEGNFLGKKLHHLDIYGCKDPPFVPETKIVWDCSGNNRQSSIPQAPTCNVDATVVFSAEEMFAWSTAMPPRTGVKIGPITGSQYIVVEVHYIPVYNISAGEKTEDIAVNFRTLPLDDPFVETNGNLVTLEKELFKGVILAHSIGEMDLLCVIPQTEIACQVYSFAFHFHRFGKHASLWRIRDNEWKLIGENHSPLAPMFFQVDQAMDLRPGDVLASRCVYNNTENFDVVMGNLYETEEMCMAFLVCLSNNLDHVYALNHCATPTDLHWSDKLKVPFAIEQYASSL